MQDTPMVSRSQAFVSSYFEPGVPSTPFAASSSLGASPPSASVPQRHGVDMSTNEAFPTKEVEMGEAADPQDGDLATADFNFDDGNLSALEKIYLFSVSRASFHK